MRTPPTLRLLSEARRGVKPRGFTLVEMLVVLAIIGILAAILFPVFSRVRESGHRTTCASNLKQIGLAMQMYARDNNNFYPLIFIYERRAEYPNDNCSFWAERVYPYLRSTEVFQCPSFEEGEYCTGCPADEGPPRFDGSYDLNSPHVNFTQNGSTPGIVVTGRTIHEVNYRRPSSTIMALDGDGSFVNPGTREPPFVGTEGLLKYGVNPHHNNGANVAFADGHVKWLSLEDLTKKSLWTLSGPQ